MDIIKQIEFPDISFYQREVDFSKMGKAAIFRAGQNIWVDTQFERNRSEAVRLGMNWGLYWFYDDRVSPGAQADALYALFSNGQARPTMEVWCDWETSYGGRYGSLANVVAFMQRVETLMPWAKVGMYTGYYWWMERTNAILNATHFYYLKKKPLWLAWYVDNPAFVLIPRPWSALTLWQYGTPVRGAEFGVKTAEIDMNWFNGTTEQFNQQYGVVTPPTEIIVDNGETMDSLIVPTHTATPKATSPVLSSGKRGINLRAAADSLSQDIGDLLVGQRAEGVLVGTDVNRQWLFIKTIDNVAVTKPTYCAAWLCDVNKIPSEIPPVNQPNVKVEVTIYDDFTGLVETFVNDLSVSTWTGRLKPPPLG